MYKDFEKKSRANGRQSLGIVAESNNNASCNKSVTFPPEDRYYESNEWYVLSKNEKDKVLRACSNRNGEKKSTKSGGKPNSGGGRNNGYEKWKSKIAILEKNIRNQKRQL